MTQASAHNRALILRYLLPVKLLLGQLPCDSLFAQFPQLACYRPLVRAVRCGDVRSLNQALEEHQEAFIRQGTYLLVEKLRSGVYRTLIKRVQAVHREREPAKAFQVPIQLFQRALAWLGVEMEVDECEVRPGGVEGCSRSLRDGVWRAQALTRSPSRSVCWPTSSTGSTSRATCRTR